jgi:hypothetical protein
MNRRHFLSLPTLAGAATAAPRRPRLAAVVTEYRWYSHADVICGRLMAGYSANGRYTPARTQLVSLYVAQTPPNDMSREVANRNNVAIYPTIAEALRLGGQRLAVDGVVFIGEHGTYPDNELGQNLYPRFELFQEILEVYRRDGRAVPTFFDKHLSYSWEKAKKIYDDARALKVPLMAGSSTTLTIRRPELTYPIGVDLDGACVVGYGPTDAYGFHLLEVLQCMVERRKGGETGVKAVRMIEGEDVWRRPADGLLEAAVSRLPDKPEKPMADLVKAPVLFEIDYESGLSARVYLLNGYTQQWAFAGKRADGRIESTHFSLGYLTRSLPHFDGLTFAIEELMLGRAPINPLERTLLTTGTLAQLFESKRQGGARIETPMLSIRYDAPTGWHQFQ